MNNPIANLMPLLSKRVTKYILSTLSKYPRLKIMKKLCFKIRPQQFWYSIKPNPLTVSNRCSFFRVFRMKGDCVIRAKFKLRGVGKAATLSCCTCTSGLFVQTYRIMKILFWHFVQTYGKLLFVWYESKVSLQHLVYFIFVKL